MNKFAIVKEAILTGKFTATKAIFMTAGVAFALELAATSGAVSVLKGASK